MVMDMQHLRNITPTYHTPLDVFDWTESALRADIHAMSGPDSAPLHSAQQLLLSRAEKREVIRPKPATKFFLAIS
ncbi:hypothetical protein ACRALDRAFT_1093754 [Sodiomyces alcalophilus JCM 7366]|uniref:uncharacterized protein n=1 Tax=Sodiomyces alcalophilus JCM 7366 TaxID=591952 RepID=UPI0039B68AD9